MRGNAGLNDQYWYENRLPASDALL